MSLQDVYNEERATTPIIREQALSDTLRRDGFHVRIHEFAVFGASTDAYLGMGLRVESATRLANEAAVWDCGENNEDSHIYVLAPIVPPTPAELEHHYAMHRERQEEEAMIEAQARESANDEIPF